MLSERVGMNLACVYYLLKWKRLSHMQLRCRVIGKVHGPFIALYLLFCVSHTQLPYFRDR